MGSLISTTADHSQDFSEPHTPSEWDVAAVRAALIERLPLELVNEIIREAQYWPIIQGSCDSHFQVQSANIDGSFDASYFCLITPPIPNSRRIKTSLTQAACKSADYDIRRKIEKVVFRITSRDQGWEEDFGWEGILLAVWSSLIYSYEGQAPYAGSWTWFDAEIWRPVLTVNDSQLGVGSSIASPTLVKPMMYSPTDESLLTAGYVRVTPPAEADARSEKAWVIQRNLRASDTIQRHTVTWYNGGLIAHDCQEHTGTDFLLSIPSLPRILSETQEDISVLYGCGNGLGFINTLQPGDRIAVIARAKVQPSLLGCQACSMADISNSFMDGAIVFTEIWLWMLYIVSLDLEPWKHAWAYVVDCWHSTPCIDCWGLYNLDQSIVNHRHEARIHKRTNGTSCPGTRQRKNPVLFSESVCISYRYLVSFSASLWIFLSLIVVNKPQIMPTRLVILSILFQLTVCQRRLWPLPTLNEELMTPFWVMPIGAARGWGMKEMNSAI